MTTQILKISSMLANIAKDWKYSVFIFLLLGYTAFSSISNYSPSAFSLKLAWSVVLMSFSFFLCYAEKISNPFANPAFRRTAYLFASFCAYLLFSVSYSANPAFGALKILNLLLSFLPLICGYYLLFSTIDTFRFRSLALIASAVVVASAVLIIFLHPFTYTGFYALSFSNWSHVIYGRFIGIISLFVLLLYLNDKLDIGNLNALLLFYLLSFLNFITSLRASLLGLLLTAIALIVFRFAQKQHNKKMIIIILSVALTFPSAFLFTQVSRHSDIRINNLIHFSMGTNVEDEPLQTRQTLYSLGVEIIKEHWGTGVGFGGFKNPEYGSDVLIKKYPHNVFLEFWIELGIPGVLMFFAILFALFRSAWKINPQTALLLIYPLTLSMFSKDIPDQTFFAIFIAFISLPPRIRDAYRAPVRHTQI